MGGGGKEREKREKLGVHSEEEEVMGERRERRTYV